MSQFLVVMKKTVVDQPFIEAQPGVDEVLAPDGVTVVEPAIPAVPEQPLVTHEEFDRAYVENDAATVAKNLAEGLTPTYDYYQIQLSGPNLQATLHPVTLKSGPRTAAPAREVVEIEAGGQGVGSVVVEV
jgi:hypothetical protein